MTDAPQSRARPASADPRHTPSADPPSRTEPEQTADDLDLFSDAAEMRRTITETSPDFIIVITPDGVIRYINRVLLELQDVNVIGTSVYNHVPPDDRHEINAAFQRVLQTGAMDSYETSYSSPERGRLTFECRVAPIFRNDAIVGMTINARDVTQQKRTEAALRDAVQSHRALIEQSPVGIVTISSEGRIVTANRAYHHMLGYEHPTLAGQSVVEITHPDDLDATNDLLTMLMTGTHVQCSIQKRYRRIDGVYVWTRVSASAIRDDDGAFVRGVAVVEDITENVRAERRQRMLMRELDHRVKNNLAAIVSLVEQTIATTDSLEAFQRTFIGRVTAMARSHEALAESQWDDLDLEQAVSAALAAYLDEHPPRVRLAGPAVMLRARIVMPLCMALHELATNAMRHGALAALDGQVAIDWSQRDGHLHLTWREANGPPVTPPAQPGLGTQLIEGFVRFELHGTLDIRYQPAGLECDMTIPMTNGA